MHRLASIATAAAILFMSGSATADTYGHAAEWDRMDIEHALDTGQTGLQPARVEPHNCDPEAWRRSRPFRLWETGQYLKAHRRLEKDSECPFEGVTFQLLINLLGTSWSFIGETEKAIETFDRIFGADKPPAEDLPNLKARDPMRYIRLAARNRQIVMLNEAHHVPRHRAFARMLAQELREEGFTYLAVEDLAPVDPETDPRARINEEKPYPSLSMGFYSKEPVFADFIRQAYKSGYKLIPYDYRHRDFLTEDCTGWCAREQAAAHVINEQIFKKDPDAKVLIYVGYDHISEALPADENHKNQLSLAMRLKELTGIDPFTIDQVGGTWKGRDGLADPVLQAIEAREHIGIPTIFTTDSDEPVVSQHYRGRVDVTLFHPRRRKRFGRPYWLSWGNRYSIAAIYPPKPIKSRVLVQAFAIDESDDAVPMDQALLMPDQRRVSLILPEGQYRIVFQDDDGNSEVIYRRHTVEPPALIDRL